MAEKPGRYDQIIVGSVNEMSLKIPGIGKPLDKYTFCVALDNEDNVCVIIKYSIKTAYGTDTIKQKLFEIRPDLRWNSTAAIIKRIKESLSSGLEGEKVVIREDEPRTYIWIGDAQFTGNSI